MIWKALTVEIIRILWDRGLYRQNKLLQQIHENWFEFWVEWTNRFENGRDSALEYLRRNPSGRQSDYDPFFR